MVIEFSVVVDTALPTPIVRVAGEIDVYTCPKLHKVLTDLVAETPDPIILDLHNVHYIDSTGLGTIAHAARSLSKASASMRVVCTRAQVRKIFEISGLTSKNISLFDSESAALAS
jgi:anti-sigma B factor antagonist